MCEECGRKFRGKVISRMLACAPGNESRTLQRHVPLPLAAWLIIMGRHPLIKCQTKLSIEVGSGGIS